MQDGGTELCPSLPAQSATFAEEHIEAAHPPCAKRWIWKKQTGSDLILDR
jgi:hypothetical protein